MSLQKRYHKIISWAVGHRSADMSAKQLIWMRLNRDARLSQGRQVGVDFGCNTLRNFEFFRTAQYWGVDLDEGALARGKARHPSANVVHATIEEAVVPKADFALCINVFHAQNFEKSDADTVMRALLRNINPGGVLIITLHCNEQFAKLRQSLIDNFEQVDELPHSLSNTPKTLLAPLVAAWHFYFGTRREPVEYYFRCLGRISDNP